MNQILPKSKEAKQKLIEFFKKTHPKLTFSLFGQRLEVATIQPPEESIIDLLVGLDAAAKKIDKRIAICFAEFQQVGLLKNHASIEAAIRHAVESSTHVTYVFSDSNRHLLLQMFSTKTRPLYHLCDLMEIKHIQPEFYLPILQERIQKRWKTSNKNDSLQEVLQLTKCQIHQPLRLFKKPGSSMLKRKVTGLQMIYQDYHLINAILAAFAHQPIDQPYGSEFT